MCRNTHTLLRVILSVLVVTIFTSQAVFGQQSAQTVIIKIKDKADPAKLVAQFGVTVVDSVPELDTYLVSGTPTNIANLSKSPNVVSIEYNVSAKISEAAMLNE